jgi:hypothetical protein
VRDVNRVPMLALLLAMSAPVYGCDSPDESACSPMTWSRGVTGRTFHDVLRNWYAALGTKSGAPEPSSAWVVDHPDQTTTTMTNGTWQVVLTASTGAGPEQLYTAALRCV